MTEVDLTADSYARWLRAGRPDSLAWFLAMAEDEQEALASIGDDYARDVCVGIGEALAAVLGTHEDEDEQIARLAASAIAKMRGDAPQPAAVQPRRETMAGLVRKRNDADADRKRSKAVGRSFLGQPADAIRGDA